MSIMEKVFCIKLIVYIRYFEFLDRIITWMCSSTSKTTTHICIPKYNDIL